MLNCEGEWGEMTRLVLNHLCWKVLKSGSEKPTHREDRDVWGTKHERASLKGSS